MASLDAVTVVITDSGHWLMEEQPRATIAAAVDFPDADSSITSRTFIVAEIDALARSGAGVGISGVGGIETIVLSGDPAEAGPYAIELKIPAHTHIAAHSRGADAQVAEPFRDLIRQSASPEPELFRKSIACSNDGPC
jgi:hypothetical protein